MFDQSKDGEPKLDWMYKGPNSTVSREEYLLGRPVDKTLEQLNEEEKKKQQQSLLPQPKNRVEHECIPPSIRDFNKLVQSEQVDLSTKLQEDPLVAIKKREEETRRQFLQNPVQLKKLQKALKAQQAKKKKKKKKKGSDSDDLDRKLAEKLLGKRSKDEKNLDIILLHKYEALKDKLTDKDMRDILDGKITDSESDEESERHKQHKKEKRKETKRRRSNDDKRKERNSYKQKYKETDSESDSNSDSDSDYKKKSYDSDDSNHGKKKQHYGLVTSDGKKIALSKNKHTEVKPSSSKKPEVVSLPKRKAKYMSEEEKERMRREMMKDATKRDKEREQNVKRYRANEEKELKEQNYNPDFIHKQLLKSADSGSVESRIKSNLNKIQRSKNDMNRNFSRR